MVKPLNKEVEFSSSSLLVLCGRFVYFVINTTAFSY